MILTFRRVSPVITLLLFLGLQVLWPGLAKADPAATPWTNQLGYQNLVYGATTSVEVQRIVGRPPDDVVKQQQIYPVIENDYYFDPSDKNHTGGATVFVFEDNILVGFMYKSPKNQYMDLTYLLPNINDRVYNSNVLGGMMGFYPNFPLYTW